jgi:hypothetical protein
MKAHNDFQRTRIDSARLLAILMLAGGLFILVFSTVYALSIPALIGLGLTFWGAILNYIQSDDYVRKPLLDRISMQTLITLNRFLYELDFQGTAVYLPPKYFPDPDAVKVYIPQRNGKLPTPEHIEEQDDQLFIQNPKGILFTPPGAEIMKLFEESLGTSFTQIDLSTLTRRLPRVIEDVLELAETVEIKLHNSSIHVQMTAPSLPTLDSKVDSGQPSPNALGPHLIGALACAFAKTTGRPIVIHQQHADPASTTIEVDFRVIDEDSER